jgi:hypothetical protein
MARRSLYRNLQAIPVRPDGQLPTNLRELIEVGGVEVLVQAAGAQAMWREREFWLPVLERYKLPEDADIFDQLTLQIHRRPSPQARHQAGRGHHTHIDPRACTQAPTTDQDCPSGQLTWDRRHSRRIHFDGLGRVGVGRTALFGAIAALRHTGKAANPAKGFAHPPQT